MINDYETRLHNQLPRVQTALNQQCVQNITASHAGFKVDDTGTTWSGKNQSGINVSCRLYEYNDEWNCAC